MKKVCQKFLTCICLLALLINSFPTIVMAEVLKEKEPIIQEETEVIEEEKDYNVEAKIIEEVEEKRTENEKHFKMSDGSIMAAMYSEKIHYLENGKYEEVDNELIELNGRYTPKKGNPNISLSKDNNSTNTLEIKNKDKKLKLGLKKTKSIKASIYSEKEVTSTSIFDLDLKNYNDKKMELNKGKNKLKYEEVTDGIDLVYEVESDKIKEYIIIKTKEALQSVFEYNIDTDELDVVQVEKNYIVLKDPKTKEELFHITSPYMYDDKGEFSDGLSISIENNTLKLELDKEWLEDEKRVYPITVDPTVNTTTVQWDIWDTYIYNGDKGVSWITRRDNPVIYAGSHWWEMFGGQPIRSLVRFPVLPALSSSDQVINATFYIKGYPQHLEGWSYPSGQVQFNIHKMTTSWNHGVNDYWANLSAASNYDSRIEDYILYSYSTSNPAPVYNADVTKMVQDWYTTGKNYGFVIKDNVETTWKQQNVAWFYSSDIGNTANRPKITITYINQSGLEGYLNYHEQNIGRTTVYTNDFNGNLILTHQDASTPGTRFPVSVNHVFNTADSNINIGLGNGFRLNLNQVLERTGNSTYPLMYIDEDGTKHWFKQLTGFCEDEENLGLRIYGSTSEYRLQDKAGNISYFHKLDEAQNKWYLTKIKDTSNNQINITYSGTNIVTVTDGIGDTINFTYSNNLLSTITDKAGRTLTYGYTGNNLTSITYPDNLITQYTYDTNKLIQVINVDNSKVKYDYYYGYNLARVKTITEYGTDGTLGNSLNLTYGQKVTTFTDSDGIVNNETFNNSGNLISTSNFNGDLTGDNVYGKTYTFGTSANNKNRLTADTNLIKPTSNYLKNHSFEAADTWYLTQWGVENGTCAYSTEEKYMGNRSLKCTGTTTNQAPVEVQSLAVPKGKTYTFSGYIKTKNIT
ncbi:MAG: hypothetical protein PHE05_04855, partial [Bacilli bacterium]|nr:hypothetical protein [Bacilli bacterium]